MPRSAGSPGSVGLGRSGSDTTGPPGRRSRPAAGSGWVDYMKVVHGYPPNLAAIKSALPIDERYAIFTYRNRLYNPSGRYIPDHLMVHEETHARQQLAFEGGTDQWWKRYLTNASFRLHQELQAFRAQYEFAKREIVDDQL